MKRVITYGTFDLLHPYLDVQELEVLTKRGKQKVAM